MIESILTPESAILVSMLGVLATGGLVVACGRRPNLRDGVNVFGATIVFLIVAGAILPAVSRGSRPARELVEVMPGLTLAFQVEPLGVVFALVASGLWIVTSLYAVGYLRAHHESHQTRFFLCFAAAIFGALGVAFSANLFTLFVFYELITLSTYPLVTHHGTVDAKRAGRVYLGVLMSTSIGLLLLGIAWTYGLAGTLEFRPGGILGDAPPESLAPLLALFAFGTAKAALMPFHRWLPAAMVAPAPVSALLHAVAVVKAGVFTVLKVVVYVFGLDLLSRTGSSDWLAAVAIVSLLTASTIALFQDNLKRRLAYSTVSQLAYIVLGAALVTPRAVVGAALHLVMHAFGKITLFFCAGAIDVVTHKKKVSQMHGIGRRMPITMTAFLIGSLSVAGIPPTGGAWSKWLLAEGAAAGSQLVAVLVYMGSSLLALSYLMPVVAKAFFLPAEPGDGHQPPEEHAQESRKHAEPLLVVLPPAVTAAACIALYFGVDPLVRLLEGILP